MAFNSEIQTYQILTNNDEICNPSLSSILLAVLALALKLKIGSQQRKQRQTKKRFASLSKWTINVSRWIDLRKTAKMVQNGVRSYLKNHLFSYTCHSRFMMWKNTRKNWQRFSYLLEVWIAEMCKKFHNGFLTYQQTQQDKGQ